MEDFKRIVKMKTGGSVSNAIAAYEKRERKSEEKSDITQDKALVKKGVKQHEAALHKGEPKTELKLKTGGRAKKSTGTVKKFEKASGEYSAKKTDEDKQNIADAKKFKPAFKKGGNVKKYSGEDGSYVKKGIDAVKSAGKSLYENVMGTPEQNRIAQESMDKQATEGSKLAKFFGGKAKAESAPVKKYGIGGSILKATKSQLAPAALFGPPAAMAVYGDMKSQEKKATEETAKDKEADAKSAPVAKCGGGKMKRGGKACK